MVNREKRLILVTRTEFAKIQHQAGRLILLGDTRCWNDIRLPVYFSYGSRLHQLQNLLEDSTVFGRPRKGRTGLLFEWKMKFGGK